jgi:hypothetical protein
MKKLILLVALLMGSPAMAVDHASGFLTSGTMTAPASGATLTPGVKWVLSGLNGGRIKKTDPSIHKGDVLHYSITLANWSSGKVMVGTSAPKVSIPGSWVNVTCGLQGLCPIADNFTTASGLITNPNGVHQVNDDVNAGGAFRFPADIAKFAKDDPLVYPGHPGASHLHMFLCATGVNAYSTYASLRTAGGTVCGNPRYPVNRTAYWTPAIIDSKGNVHPPYFVNDYYKNIARSNPACLAPGASYDPATDHTHIGICVEIPNGIRYVDGYDMGGMSMPALASRSYSFQCLTPLSAGNYTPRSGTATGIDGSTQVFATIADLVASGACQAGDHLHELIEGPTCWDGLHVDSPNHRDHVSHTIASAVFVGGNRYNGDAYGQYVNQCPATHPYAIPMNSLLIYYIIDADFLAGGWRLASDDDMSMTVKHGETIHYDYWEAWSPTVKDTWTNTCLDQHESCSGGDLGDGTEIAAAQQVGNMAAKYGVISGTRFGLSRPVSGNGTFTGEVRADSDGEFYITSGDGATGEITAFSLTDQSKAPHTGSITIHGSVP